MSFIESFIYLNSFMYIIIHNIFLNVIHSNLFGLVPIQMQLKIK